MITNVTAHQKWIEYVSYPSFNINLERVSSLSKLKGDEVQKYVLRTLKILDKYRSKLPADQYELLYRTLAWSEVSKCGSPEDRDRWINLYGDLTVHNEASAKIYHDEVTEVQSKEAPYEDKINELVELLIRTHGLLGQVIRGEVKLKSINLSELLSYMTRDAAWDLLMILNECIIAGVDPKIWKEAKHLMYAFTGAVLTSTNFDFSIEHKTNLLLPRVNHSEEVLDIMKDLTEYQLWYMNATFKDITPETTIDILKAVRDIIPKKSSLKHIMFQPLLNNLYYDYKGMKKINIYKLRIIQHCLKNGLDTDHCKFSCTLDNKRKPTILKVDFVFSEVCQSLLDFCVKAEQSETLTYEKSIALLFDIFGLRLDQFDRLNNEDIYLETMNNSNMSTKESILEFATGTDIVDVGSGGGILLDKLETLFPNANIIGTDISKTVIDKLTEKAKCENHRWTVKRHNFVEGPLPFKVDTIIFSSILHEIFSYTEFEGKKFNLQSVYTALTNAYKSLNSGGKLIIRDGVKTKGSELFSCNLSEEGYEFFKNFDTDFKGDIPHEYSVQLITGDTDKPYNVSGDINFMREFLYTYTWGLESYPHEVQEQFGYLTLDEFTNFLKKLGLYVLNAKEFLEEGYRKHLDTKIFTCKKYPNSNCIIVAEKP